MLWRILLVVLTAGILVVSLSPSPSDDGLGWDKANHAVAMAVVTITACLAFRPAVRAVVAGGLYAMALGGMIELLQAACTVTRSAEWGDLAADLVGTTAGVLLLVVSRRKGWRV
jgi:VanZ family protein